MAKSPIQLWFRGVNTVYRQVPVNPETIEIESPYGVNTVNISNLGEVAILGERGLKRISFSSFFPRSFNANYCDTNFVESPWTWVHRVEYWRDKRQSVRFNITSTDISLQVYIEEFTIQPEKAGSPGDIYYSMTLVEHRPIQAKIVQTPKTAKQTTTSKTESRPAAQKAQQKTHTVVKGETLSLIAKKYYGKVNDWQRIYNANKTVIGKDPNKIKVGQKLVIP